MGEPEQADIRVGLTGVGAGRRFVIQNLGKTSAYDVHLALEPEAGKNTPLIQTEVEENLPIAELAPNSLYALSAVITTGTGIRFNATLSWRNGNGSTSRAQATLEV